MEEKKMNGSKWDWPKFRIQVKKRKGKPYLRVVTEYGTEDEGIDNISFDLLRRFMDRYECRELEKDATKKDGETS